MAEQSHLKSSTKIVYFIIKRSRCTNIPVDQQWLQILLIKWSNLLQWSVFLKLHELGALPASRIAHVLTTGLIPGKLKKCPKVDEFSVSRLWKEVAEWYLAWKELFPEELLQVNDENWWMDLEKFWILLMKLYNREIKRLYFNKRKDYERLLLGLGTSKLICDSFKTLSLSFLFQGFFVSSSFSSCCRLRRMFVWIICWFRLIEMWQMRKINRPHPPKPYQLAVQITTASSSACQIASIRDRFEELKRYLKLQAQVHPDGMQGSVGASWSSWINRARWNFEESTATAIYLVNLHEREGIKDDEEIVNASSDVSWYFIGAGSTWIDPIPLIIERPCWIETGKTMWE